MDDAETGALRLARVISSLLEDVHAPASLSGTRLVEQLSFLQLRENFRSFLDLLASARDVPAAHLTRTMFEESARWAWVDEDEENRRQAFLNESSPCRHLIEEAAREQGIDSAPLFGDLVEEAVPPYEKEAIRFPRFEERFSWSPTCAG